MTSPRRTVIVTGAAGGLGKAIAEAFLATGANVAICDVNVGRLAATEKEWTTVAGYSSDNFLTALTDVTDEASVEKLVADTVAKFGRLDVLVNNAGIMDDFSPVNKCSRDLWDKVMGVNVLGPYNTMRAAITQFTVQEQNQTSHQNGDAASHGTSNSATSGHTNDAATATNGGGVIINICSVAARSGHHAGAAYTASKHALYGLSKNTAFSYADQGIYSIAMMLGGMATNIADAMRNGIDVENYTKQQAAQTPLDPAKHLVAVENVARYAVFVSDRQIAKGLNGSAVEMTNNWPEA
ncbi:hypothetical protein BD289DRAFT_449602 [Coniella lustricola]|uniref:Uncharacterized protein n=1 Tax=Coniella lustricola TaxID=2025994 RepID=A0A2T3ALE6_9PEZI|nr:hypothetical protein BD289DRAFT_449602 [Coniella lustricola]